MSLPTQPNSSNLTQQQTTEWRNTTMVDGKMCNAHTNDKPPQLSKNDNSHPMQHHDCLTMATKMRKGCNTLQTTTSAHENHAHPPPSTSPIAKCKAITSVRRSGSVRFFCPKNGQPWTVTGPGPTQILREPNRTT